MLLHKLYSLSVVYIQIGLHYSNKEEMIQEYQSWYFTNFSPPYARHSWPRHQQRSPGDRVLLSVFDSYGGRHTIWVANIFYVPLACLREWGEHVRRACTLASVDLSYANSQALQDDTCMLFTSRHKQHTNCWFWKQWVFPSIDCGGDLLMHRAYTAECMVHILL